MFNFLTITLDKTREVNHVRTLPPFCHLPRLFFLYKRYEKYLHDDYTEKMNFKQFITLAVNNRFFWLITEELSGNPAGFVYLDNITGNDTSLYSAEITTCFEKSYWGEKTHICAMEFFELIFKKFGFYKIRAQIYPQNFRVKTLLQKCGFIKECTLKNETMLNGKLQDIELYALFNKKKCEELNEN